MRITGIVLILNAMLVGCRGPGSYCDTGDECDSGNCSIDDHVCCDVTCDEVCFSCRLPGREGTCTPIPDGTPDMQSGEGLVPVHGMWG